jgi:hypothetical protein
LDWVLHEKFGQQQGIELALDLARAADKAVEQKGASFFAAASEYLKLNVRQKAAIIADLKASKKLLPPSSGGKRRC